MARPKDPKEPAPVAEEKSCGYIMHQVRRVQCKMRWGELLLGRDKTNLNWCQIALFKFDLTNPKLGVLAKKDMKLKASFTFTEADFCGLEKGQHITKHGTKRYICIILKDQHIIFQDAVIAMTSANHDVIQTWYKKITNSMHYMYRWRMLSIQDQRFLHVSKLNTSVCLSLHNSNESMKKQVLLQQQYKTGTIEKVTESQEKQPDGTPCTRATVRIRDVDENVCFILEAGKSLSDLINDINSMNSVGFDVLGPYQNPNLIRLPQHARKAGEFKGLKQLTEGNKSSIGNMYVPNTPNTLNLPMKEPGELSKENDRHVPYRPTTQNDVAAPNWQQNNRHPPDKDGVSIFYPPNAQWTAPNHRNIPPRVPPREPSEDSKKAIDRPVTFDSGFHTSECVQHSNGTQYSDFPGSDTVSPPNVERSNVYVNMADLNSSTKPFTSHSTEITAPPVPPTVEVAPELPPRDIPVTIPNNHSADLIERALRSQSLPPLDPDPNARLPGYENSLSVEVTVDLVLHQNHGENIDVSLGLPHSAYLAIVLGLENNAVAGGDWRGLASALSMSFEDVNQIEAATQHRERLYPAHIVLVHWFRTQAPYPFTRLSLKMILSRVMNRLDLANMIPTEYDKERRCGNNP